MEPGMGFITFSFGSLQRVVRDGEQRLAISVWAKAQPFDGMCKAVFVKQQARKDSGEDLGTPGICSRFDLI
jgi:hypothetical protein